MEIKITYLQMFVCPAQSVPPPREDLQVIHAKRPTISYYRYLYEAVGAPWQWRSRKKLTDAELAAIIHDPLDEVHVLHVDGVPAGFAELDRRTAGEIEVVQFGLMREVIGQGLGRYFIHWAVERAWRYGPRRLWPHTDTEDHPAAIPNYRKAGFQVYDVQTRPASRGD